MLLIHGENFIAEYLFQHHLGPSLIIISFVALTLYLLLKKSSTVQRQNSDSITNQIDYILQSFRNGDPSKRLSIEHGDSSMVKHLNDIFDTFEYVIDREKSFSSNISHELKTPLTELISSIDLAQMKERSPAEYKQRLNDLSAICNSMSEMHDNILALARSDQGMITVDRKPFSIHDALLDCLHNFDEEFNKKNVSVFIECPKIYNMNRGREKIRMVFNNLFSNMLCYVNDSGTASVKIQGDVSGIGISFKNSGCTLDAADAVHTLEPFWRSGPDQHQNKRHLGIGLNMCQRILTALGANIKIHISKNGSFYANVFLPHDLLSQ